MAALPAGTILGPYRIEGLIGRGGMGVVRVAEPGPEGGSTAFGP